MIYDDVFSIILYFSDEDKKRSEDLFYAIHSQISKYFKNCEIVILDNSNNSDYIKYQLQKLKDLKISYLKMSEGETEDSAFSSGINYSIGDFIVEIPICHLDKNNNLEFIFSNIDLNYDVIFFRKKSNLPVKKSFYNFFSRTIQNKINLQGSIFHIISRRALNKTLSSEENIINRRVVYSKIGQNNKNILLDNNRKINYSLDLLIDTVLFYSPLGIKLIKTLVILFSLITILISFYSIGFFIFGSTVEGWTTTILFLSFISLSLFVILFVILKYLYFMFMILNKRKHDSIDSIEIYDN